MQTSVACGIKIVPFFLFRSIAINQFIDFKDIFLCFPSTDFSQASTVARDFFRESVKVSASRFNSFMESSVNKLKSGHSKILFSERTISSSVFLFSSSDSKLFSCFAVSFSTETLLSKSDFAFESSLCARSISDLICSALSAQALQHSKVLQPMSILSPL